MRMYHPTLEYTKAKGQEVSEAAFRLAWQPVGWLEWPPAQESFDIALVDGGDEDE